MPKPRIDAKEAADDIKAGMDDAALMKKYKLSAKGLQSLIKKLVEAGALLESHVKDRLGEPEGSIIIDYSSLTLEVSADPTAIQSTVSDQREPRRCLVASEDAELLELVRKLSHADGFSVDLLPDTAETDRALDGMYMDVVIVDVDLTRIDYLEIVRGTKQSGNFTTTIVISGPSRRNEAARGILEGAFSVVDRPLDKIILANAIQRAFEYSDFARFQRDHTRFVEERVREQTAELCRTKDLLKGILDSSSLVSVVLTDPDQNVRFWNKGAENIFGYSAEEMIGQKITRIYPPDAITKESVEDLRNTAATKQGSVHTKMRQVAKDGRLLTVALAVTPMLNEAGELRGILGMGLDLTEEVRQNKEIVKLVQKVKQTQDAAVLALARLTEARDGLDNSHLTRIQEYCRVLCSSLVRNKDFSNVMNQKYVDDLVRSSVLHDVGKVMLPDAVLLFKGKFGPKEWEIIKQHPLIGGRALQDAVKKLGADSFLSTAMEVAFYHHERWDGNGYPFGLKEEEIPLSARIVAIADTYDALTGERTYRKAYSHEEASAIILEEAGSHFDPRLVVEFSELQGEFKMIRKVFS